MPVGTSSQKKVEFVAKQAPNLPITFFQSQGPRSEQQDHYSVLQLSKPLDKAGMSALFSAMSAATNSKGDRSIGGATVNLLAISDGRLIAGNLGDSLTTLFINKANGSEIKAWPLSALHVPGAEAESKRLKPLIDPARLFIEQGRICIVEGESSDSLGISRILGHERFKPMVTQTPEIQEFKFKASECVYAQVALYTDGITDVGNHMHDDLKYDTVLFGELINADKRMTPDTALSIVMGYWAMENGLYDNATALSIDLKKYDGKTPLLLAVFDGNGKHGNKVAKAAIAALENHPLLN